MEQVVRSVRSLVNEAAVAMVSPYAVAAATDFAEHKSVAIDTI